MAYNYFHGDESDEDESDEVLYELENTMTTAFTRHTCTHIVLMVNLPCKSGLAGWLLDFPNMGLLQSNVDWMPFLTPASRNTGLRSLWLLKGEGITPFLSAVRSRCPLTPRDEKWIADETKRMLCVCLYSHWEMLHDVVWFTYENSSVAARFWTFDAALLPVSSCTLIDIALICLFRC